jgi:AraC-like DNA-binding protein
MGIWGGRLSSGMTPTHGLQMRKGSCALLAGEPTLPLTHFRFLVLEERDRVCLYAPGISLPNPMTLTVSCTFDLPYLDEQPTLYTLARLLRQWREPTPLILHLPDWYGAMHTLARSYFAAIDLVLPQHRSDLHRSHVNLILGYLYAILSQTLPWAGNAGAKDPVMQKFLALVDQHGEASKSITFYARELLVSISALRKLCQATLGLSPSEVIQQRRLRTARQWLLDTTLPIGDIADRLGYNGHAYFSEHFRQHTGISPREYRQQHAVTK